MAATTKKCHRFDRPGRDRAARSRRPDIPARASRCHAALPAPAGNGPYTVGVRQLPLPPIVRRVETAGVCGKRHDTYSRHRVRRSGPTLPTARPAAGRIRVVADVGALSGAQLHTVDGLRGEQRRRHCVMPFVCPERPPLTPGDSPSSHSPHLPNPNVKIWPGQT